MSESVCVSMYEYVRVGIWCACRCECMRLSVCVYMCGVKGRRKSRSHLGRKEERLLDMEGKGGRRGRRVR